MSGRVAVVTVSYRSGRDVLRALASVPAASVDEVDTIVVNNAVDDALADVRAAHPEASVLDSGANLGYGRAVNLAAARLGDEIEWILITNPDTEFRPGSIDELLRVATSDARIGAVGPAILNTDGTVYPSARDVPSLTAGTGHALLHRIKPDNRWSARYLRADKTANADREPVPAGWLSGSCVMVRRSSFDAVGGFDDRFFMYFEDVDLGERLGNEGWRVLYVPTATVVHEGGTTTRGHSAAMLRVHHKSAYRYLAKRYHHWYQLPLRVALRIGIGARAALATRGVRGPG